MSDNGQKQKADQQDYSGQNLKGKRFKGEDLSGGNFSGADLTNARFFDCNLTGADFSKANLQGVLFEGGKIDKAQFSEAMLKKARFKKLPIVDCTVGDADFSKVSLNKVELKNCRFENTKFDSGVFQNMELSGCEFTKCSFAQLHAPDSVFADSKFDDCVMVRNDLVSTTLQKLRFDKCDLGHSDLSGARLIDVVFDRCGFKQAMIIACHFENTQFNDCDFEKALIKYPQGLSDEDLAKIEEAGGKIGLDLMRKTGQFLVHTWPGRAVLALIVLAIAGLILYRTYVPSSWSYEVLAAAIEKSRAKNDFEQIKKYHGIVLHKFGQNPFRATLSYVDLGQILLMEAEYEKARDSFLKAQELNKENILSHPEILLGLGDAELGLKNFDKAEGYYKQVIEGAEQEEIKDQARFGVVRVHQTSGDDDKALAMIDELIAQKQDSPQAWDWIDAKIKILRKQKRYDEAIALLEQATQSNEDDRVRRAFIRLAEVERERGNNQGAEQALKKLVQRFPDAKNLIDQSQIGKAQNLIQNNQVAEGEKMLKGIMKNALLDSTRKYAKMTLAMHYLYSHRREDAEKLLLELKDELKPTDTNYSNLHVNLSILYRMDGNDEKAMSMLAEALANSNDDPGIQHAIFQERAHVHQMVGNFDKAKEDLERAAALAPNAESREEVYLSILSMATGSEEPDTVISLADKYEKLIEDPERKRRLQGMKAQNLLRDGKTDKAVSLYKTLIDQFKDNPKRMTQYRIEIINALGNGGNEEDAFKMFKELADGDIASEMITNNFNMLNGMFMGIDGSKEVFVEYYTKAIAAMEDGKIADNNYFTAMVNLAKTYEELGKKDEAFDLYDKVIAQSNDEFPRLQALENMFQYYLVKGQYDQADKVIVRVPKEITSDRGKIVAEILKGSVHSQKGEHLQTIEVLKGALKMCDADIDGCRVLSSLADGYRAINDEEGLQNLYKREKDNWPGCHTIRELKDKYK